MKNNSDMYFNFLEDIEDLEGCSETLVEENFGKPVQKRNKQSRKKNKYHKDKKLYEKTKNSCFAPIYKHEDGSFRRCSYGERRKRFYKKHSNRLIRRVSNKQLKTLGPYTGRKGNLSHKLFDYDWEID